MDKPKCWVKNTKVKVKVEVGLKFEMTFLTQHLGLSIFYPNLGSNNPESFRVHVTCKDAKIKCYQIYLCWLIVSL